MARDVAALMARVKKLLALATSSNVHEAAAAAARAQALIEEHRLAALLEVDAQAADDVTDGRDAPLETSKRLRRWKVLLATALGESNGCVAWTEVRGDVSALCLAGRAGDRDATAALYAWLVTRIEWLSATHGAGRVRRWHEAFRVGAAEVVAERFSSVPAEARAGIAATSLVPLDAALAARRAAVDRFVTERLRLGKGRTFSVDAHGYRRGRKAGATLPLS